MLAHVKRFELQSHKAKLSFVSAAAAASIATVASSTCFLVFLDLQLLFFTFFWCIVIRSLFVISVGFLHRKLSFCQTNDELKYANLFNMREQEIERERDRDRAAEGQELVRID